MTNKTQISLFNIGKAGELRVASELLLRGHTVYLTLVDNGVDVVLGNGLHIQVKTARGDKASRYTFSFKSWRMKGQHYEAHGLANVDFVILWQLEDGRFFIVPADKIRGRYTVKINGREAEKFARRKVREDFVQYLEAWDLLSRP